MTRRLRVSASDSGAVFALAQEGLAGVEVLFGGIHIIVGKGYVGEQARGVGHSPILGLAKRSRGFVSIVEGKLGKPHVIVGRGVLGRFFEYDFKTRGGIGIIAGFVCGLGLVDRLRGKRNGRGAKEIWR